MNNKIVISLLAILAFYGCQKKNMLNENTQTVNKLFTAVIEEEFPNTKTSVDNEGNILWGKGDLVSIFAGSTNNDKYQVTDAYDGKGSAELVPVSTGSGNDIDNNVALYPYQSSASITKISSNYTISDITLPATQTYAAGSFGNGTFPMVAVTTSTSDKSLKFKNILGVLKLQLKGTASIVSIQITGNNNEILCGAASITASNGNTPSVALTDESAKTVTLDCGEGVQLNNESATPFLIALPPMTMTGGFTVVVKDSEGKQMEIKTTKEQTITRSSILRMPEITYEGEDKPLTFTSTGSTSLSLRKVGNPYEITLEYKVNDGLWTAYTIGEAISLNDKDQVSFQACTGWNTHFSKYSDEYYYFKISGSGTVAASGNIMSLIEQTMNTLTITDKYCFSSLFSGCNLLTQSPELPAKILADGCYLSMFYGCTALTTAPELPSTTLACACYNNMFQWCTALTKAPELSATTLASQCYGGMFDNCTSLTIAPTLPATTLSYACYSYMFCGCTALTTAPELPAIALANGCYWSMFQECKSLTTAPELPATTLAKDCYEQMFNSCTALTKAPELPATTLAGGCYSNMFKNCTSLTIAPTLPATTLVEYCYRNMFDGCTKLNYVKALFTTTPSDTYTENWLKDVSPTGTFVKNQDATWDVTGVNGVPEGWTIKTEQPLTFISTGSTEISLCKTGTPYDISIEYKKNDGNWTTYSIGETISLNDKDQISFQAGSEGNAQFSKDYKNCYKFKISGSGTVAAFGNIMSLVDQSMETVTIPDKNYFWNLFNGCKALTKAPEFPATTLTERCYMNMFYGCTALTNAPKLPATILANYCYAGMFSGCTSLTSAPALPAMTLANQCYQSMFQECKSLTTSPALPATTLAESCYGWMFNGCTSLTTAPELPAATLASQCYYSMFSGCTSLTTAPELPATTLAYWCYGSMFNYCLLLNTIPEELPASTLADYCYQHMFSGCTSLTTTPELPATVLAEYCYEGMFSDCTSLTNTSTLPATTLSNSCYKSMFSGCTSLTTAPELPATNLEECCYNYMFHGCTTLTTAPDLPATTLADYCYQYMFSGCKKLNYVKALFTTNPSNTYTGNWVSGVSSTGTFIKSKDATWDVRGFSGIPYGWTVQTE